MKNKTTISEKIVVFMLAMFGNSSVFLSLNVSFGLIPNSTTELYFIYGFIGMVCWAVIWLVVLKILNLMVL